MKTRVEETPSRDYSRAAANVTDTEAHPIQAKSIAPPRSGYGISVQPYSLAPPIAQRKPSAGKIENQTVLVGQSKKTTLQRSAFVDYAAPKEKTDTGFEINHPRFDGDKMTKELPKLQIAGSGEVGLKEAMLTLYGHPTGAELESALAVVAKTRGLSIEHAREQYKKAMDIRAKGRERARKTAEGKGEKYDDVSPDLATDIHDEFTGSLPQLRFGSILGEVFGIDPVFGALISPTGGLAGPGNKSVQLSDNNPVALHGTVHDAAGYLTNAHGTGPGYNYLNKSWELSTTNKFSGQVSGIEHWTNAAIQDFVDQTMNKLKKAASSVWTGAKNIASKAWQGTKNAASKVWQGTKNIASKAWQGTKNVASKVAKGAKLIAKKAYNGAKLAIDKTVEGAKKAIDAVWEGAKSIGKATQATAISAWNGVTSAAHSVVDGAKNVASNAWEGTKNVTSSAWNKVTSWF
jgi:hypothetical protein